MCPDWDSLVLRYRCIYSRSGGHPGGGGTRSRRDSGKGMGHWPLGDRAVVDERCTLADLGKAIHTRDALDIGFPDQVGCRGCGDRGSVFIGCPSL